MKNRVELFKTIKPEDVKRGCSGCSYMSFEHENFGSQVLVFLGDIFKFKDQFTSYVDEIYWVDWFEWDEQKYYVASFDALASEVTSKIQVEEHELGVLLPLVNASLELKDGHHVTRKLAVIERGTEVPYDGI